MKFTVLMGSPRPEGNTAALLRPFLEECTRMGVETHCFRLNELSLSPCRGCMACQEVPDRLGCVQEDDLSKVFEAMKDCDVMVLATPIYSWYCTPAMKALMDRAIYAGNKYYGREKGASLLEGRRVATVVTCGYRPQEGADLWEQGLKRWCTHGKMEYMGMLCRRDLGRKVPFLDEEKEQAARDFAQAICLAVKTEELCAQEFI
ncbi:flavodoxin family protein [Pseudoflavonifractor sp. AF19-9AC]|uniref:flavodoxin family protein n=1 Tax=Pseudoflavonifractor sp. AF19-9AC TaxID=2292244 RepID=UPI000E4B06E9|nr:flavodoxin family protein [Pseudoflavonifractor sp. AF19-9AC]RHR09093.1 flavodoxin family protein [Pseudoflavonifractor sp. AF19-9AC]